MKKLLLVDDEQIFLDFMATMVRDALLDVHLLLASSMQQAIALCEKHTIDILFSDIEMPRGDGFELLEWMREHAPDTVCLFFTCHEEFSYAQRAMQLGCLDYLLKPIDKERFFHVLNQALERVDRLHEQRADHGYRAAWERGKRELTEWFYRETIQQRISGPSIDYIAQKHRFTLLPGTAYTLILVDLRCCIHGKRGWDEDTTSFSINSILDKSVCMEDESTPILTMSKYLKTIILTETDPARIEAGCQQFIDEMRRMYDVATCCYISDPCQYERISTAYESCLAAARENVACFDRVIHISDLPWEKTELEEFDLLEVKRLLMLDDIDGAEQVIHRYLDRQAQRSALSMQAVQNLLHRFLKMLFSMLKERQLQADQFISAIAQERTSSDELLTIPQIQQYLHAILTDTLQYANLMEKPRTLADRVESYIRDHLEEDLSCNEISAHFFFHADYLTRLLKQETGMSLLDLYTRTRMNVARELLTDPNIPITMVAMKAGYGNISHFSRMFRVINGVSPSEYRKNWNAYENVIHY